MPDTPTIPPATDEEKRQRAAELQAEDTVRSDEFRTWVAWFFVLFPIAFVIVAIVVALLLYGWD